MALTDYIKKKPDRYNDIVVAAHEFGHAKELERAGSLRRSLHLAGPISGNIGSLIAMKGLAGGALTNPMLAAAPMAAGQLPGLYEEGKASKNALAALKKIGVEKTKGFNRSDTRLAKAFGTYLGKSIGKIGLTGAVGAVLAGAPTVGLASAALGAAGLVGRRVANKAIAKEVTRKANPIQMWRLRRAMGVKAKVFRTRNSELAGYLPPMNKLNPAAKKRLAGVIGKQLKRPTQAGKLLESGGVLLPA